MSEIKFALTTSLEPIRQLALDANFAEVEAQLRELMAPYEKLVVNPEDMADAKNILARIRKVKTGIDEYRKSVKREYSAPLTVFEAKVKELLAVCTESETNLSEQINKYDQQRRKEKLDGLERFFSDAVGDMSQFLAWEQVRNDRWGNATFSEADAQAEIQKAIDDCASGVEAIRSLNSPFAASLLRAYAANHDLAGAMRMNSEFIEQQRREDERVAAMETAKATAEREEIREVQRIQAANTAPAPTEADMIHSFTLVVSGTVKQLKELRHAMDAIGIRFSKVE